MKKEIICTVCPRGCNVTVEDSGNEIKSIEGYSCKRGMEFAKSEFTNPVRILTTLVKIDGAENDLLPVRSDKPISKTAIFDCMEIIKKTVTAEAGKWIHNPANNGVQCKMLLLLRK